MCRAARETEEKPHLPLHEAPTGRNYQSMRVNKPFSYQEIQRIKQDLGHYLGDPEKYIRAFKGVTLLYDLIWKDQQSENEDHGIQSHHFMGNRWETVETVSDFILGGSKITADGDFSHEIKRCLLLGRKVMTNLDSIFKSRDITLPTKVCLVKAMVFPLFMYGCES